MLGSLEGVVAPAASAPWERLGGFVMAFCRVYLMGIGTRQVESFPNPLFCFSNESSLLFFPPIGLRSCD